VKEHDIQDTVTRLDFFIACVPFKVTHHAKRIVRIGKFSRLADKKELRQARQTYESLLQPFRPQRSLTGPVRLSLTFSWPHLKSSSAKRRAAAYPKTTKPDCSNLAKTFEDCLVRTGFFVDDAQVVELLVRKVHGGDVGIRVSIQEIPC
jgi:Holliday junction resolvase RusA-like endonuclease